MDRYVTLYNVIDTRTGKYHSVVMVRESKAKYFIPALREEKKVEFEETIDNTPKADAEEVIEEDK